MCRETGTNRGRKCHGSLMNFTGVGRGRVVVVVVVVMPMMSWLRWWWGVPFYCFTEKHEGVNALRTVNLTLARMFVHGMECI